MTVLISTTEACFNQRQCDDTMSRAWWRLALNITPSRISLVRELDRTPTEWSAVLALAAAAVLIIPWIMLYVYLVLGASWSIASLAADSTIDVNIEAFTPEHNDQYVCVAKKLDEDVSYYLTKFSPVDNNGAAHHILLYGCPEPGKKDQPYWGCGEMSSDHKSSIPDGPICGGGSSGSILFAEAMHAGDTNLPEDVSFQVGKGTEFKYLVIQIHYGNVDKFVQNPQLTDDSGIRSTYQTSRTKYLGAIYLMVSGGAIPPNRFKEDRESLDIVCDPTEERAEQMMVFAFRTHAHAQGELITGYRVRDERSGQVSWTPIARKSPQLEQTFYPLSRPIEIDPSDTIIARCLFNNPTGETIQIGATMKDEMCNLYLMYYTLGGPTLGNNVCFTRGRYHWEQVFEQVPPEVEHESTTLSYPEQFEVAMHLQEKQQMMKAAADGHDM